MENQSKGGCLSVIVVILVICGLFSGCQHLFGINPHDDADSIASAHTSVPDYLKSPSTAHFANNDTVTKEGDGYVVTGSVDCENSFGATVRVDYTVTEDKDNNVTNVNVQDRF